MQAMSEFGFVDQDLSRVLVEAVNEVAGHEFSWCSELVAETIDAHFVTKFVKS